jgi:uncharacterized protein (TIGR00730 family)
MSSLRSVCVFCGSSPGTEPAFLDSARELGCLLGTAGVTLVYGGGSTGLMGTLARAALDCGGAVVGVIPEFLIRREVAFEGAHQVIVTRDMHERKRTMFERADAFVALPGGIGTLEETVEQMTWAQLGQHRKPILLANIAGFWDPLCALLDHMRDLQFLHSAELAEPLVVAHVADILPALEAALRQVPAADKEGIPAAIERM